jgi:uncharacterized protein YkwD
MGKMTGYRRMAASLGVLFLLAACASTQSNMAPPPPERVNLTSLPQGASAAAQGENALTRAVLANINDYRAKKSLPPLAEDQDLRRAAAVHSADMVTRGFLGHFNPDGQGPNERVKAVKPDFKGTVAENIGVTAISGTPDDTAAALMKLWVASPPHRKNMVGAAYTLAGVGAAEIDGKVFVTVVFAGS